MFIADLFIIAKKTRSNLNVYELVNKQIIVYS